MNDSPRIFHNLIPEQNTFRENRLSQILNDIDAMITDKGFLEPTYSGVFLSGMIVWNAPAKNFKKAEVVITRTGTEPFANTILCQIYDNDGTIVVAATTTTISRNASKQVINTQTVTVRP